MTNRIRMDFFKSVRLFWTLVDVEIKITRNAGERREGRGLRRGEGKEGRRHRAATPVPATAEERRKDGGKREERESAL